MAGTESTEAQQGKLGPAFLTLPYAGAESGRFLMGYSIFSRRDSNVCAMLWLKVCTRCVGPHPIVLRINFHTCGAATEKYQKCLSYHKGHRGKAGQNTAYAGKIQDRELMEREQLCYNSAIIYFSQDKT